MRRLGNFGQNNQGGRNKQEGWQKFPKWINSEIGISGKAGKNPAIKNFIEIKPSILWKYQ